MGIFSTLFSSDNIVNKAADGIYNGIDKIVYTDEEKAEIRLKAAEHFLKLLKAYEPFKIAQRLLALTFAIPYVAVWLVCAALFLYGALASDTSAVSTSKELAKMNNETLATPVALILAFYFSGGMLEGALREWKKKEV